MTDLQNLQTQLKKVKKTRDKVTFVLFTFGLLLGTGFYFQEVEAILWQYWFTFMLGLLGFWFGTKSLQDIVRSIWYRPELDDDHPEAQRAASERATI
jgi:hypothetical protein